MEIRDSKVKDAVIVEPAGRLDTRGSHPFEAKVTELLKAGEKSFVVDLAELEYISSAGLRVLVMLAKKLHGEGRLALCRLQEQVREVFDVAGFSNLFTITDTREQALTALASFKPPSETSKLGRLAAKLMKAGDDELPPALRTPRHPGGPPKNVTVVSSLAAQILAGRRPPKPEKEGDGDDGDDGA